MKRHILAFIFVLLMAGNARGEEVSVACAANFTAAMKEIAAEYKASTGITVLLTFGSTGMLFGQIQNGAPYDIFFAADEKRPDLLHEQGKAEKPEPYATGRVVLWTSRESSADNWFTALESFEYIGAANPRTAPYGAAALDALKAKGALDATRSRLVFGKSVGQAFHFAHTGAAQAAFCARSQAISAGNGIWLAGARSPCRQAGGLRADWQCPRARFLPLCARFPGGRGNQETLWV
ncbi:molybdate ABC transporter substrate-binding protein [Salidesulfovibrio brasiliensis]|uniref:molybdate ABC transporter substrate-binding protein n=1 Tax=Salidesulfovibrio brasiliensis TaxID=221711 RepID=UPI0006D06725|nr:molybdate ABC transporter substrate-binding protein [Salidesulfovibrio brasiliensis]